MFGKFRSGGGDDYGKNRGGGRGDYEYGYKRNGGEREEEEMKPQIDWDTVKNIKVRNNCIIKKKIFFFISKFKQYTIINHFVLIQITNIILIITIYIIYYFFRFKYFFIRIYTIYC